MPPLTKRLCEITMEFTFDDTALERVAAEVANAKEFIKIAVFQIHNDEIIDALNTALSRKVSVEIITLPYDSIHPEVRENVEQKLKGLEKKGAALHFCKWGVGDPSRTTTAVGRWYSFHGKFIVTDKCAIAISANLTNQKELDAMLVYTEKDKIKEFAAKFDALKMLFIGTKDKEAEVKQLIEKSGYSEWRELLEAPSTIKEEEVRAHWIRDYPVSILKSDTKITDGIYLTPFEFKARELYEQLILNTSKIAYISTESFTDEDMIKVLIKAQLSGIDVRVLTGGVSQDFQTRIRELYPEAASSGVKIRVPDADLHAKLIITDKVLLVGSVNLNKMNLGTRKNKELWRANTETVTICTDGSIIKRARESYVKIFNQSKDVLEFLAEKEEGGTKSIFEVFDKDIRVKKDVRRMFARLIISNKVRSKWELYTIARYAYLIARNFAKRNVIELTDFVSAVVLNYLTESMKTTSQISKKVQELSSDVKISEILSFLTDNNLITKEGDFYKINIDRLIR